MTAMLLKEIELTPADIAELVRVLRPDELDDLRQRLLDHGLILGWANGQGGWEQETDEHIPEFWKLIDVEPLPEPPPPTPEGDKIALAALDEIHGLFPITDPELGCWIAESAEAAIYNTHLDNEKKSPELQERLARPGRDVAPPNHAPGEQRPRL